MLTESENSGKIGQFRVKIWSKIVEIGIWMGHFF